MALQYLSDYRQDLYAAVERYRQMILEGGSSEDAMNIVRSRIPNYDSELYRLYKEDEISCIQELFTSPIDWGMREMVRGIFDDTSFYEPRLFGPCVSGDHLQMVPDTVNLPFTDQQEVIRDERNGFTFFGHQVGSGDELGFHVLAAFTHDPRGVVSAPDTPNRRYWRSGRVPQSSRVFLGVFNDMSFRPNRIYLVGGHTVNTNLAVRDAVLQGCTSPLNDNSPNSMIWEDIVSFGDIETDEIIADNLNLEKDYYGFRLSMLPVRAISYYYARIQTFHLYA